MKRRLFTPRRLLAASIALIVLHVVLLHVLSGTRVIERIMAMQFSVWDALLVVGFFQLRVAVYLVVPPLLAALGVWELLRRLSLRAPR